MKKILKQPNLISILLLKEKVFWKRTLLMKKEKNMNWLGFIIATIFITPFHYMFAFMHFMFECFLWIFNRDQFKDNINLEYKNKYK